MLNSPISRTSRMLFTFPYLPIACSTHRIDQTKRTIRQGRIQVQHQPSTGHEGKPERRTFRTVSSSVRRERCPTNTVQ